MAIGYIPLPKYNPGPQGIDFSPLSRGIQSLTEGIKENRLLDQSKQIGSAIQSGDYKGGAAKAYEFGDLNTGLNLANTQRQIEQDQFNRNRLLTQDRRAAASDARSQQLHGLKVKELESGAEERFNTKLGVISNAIRSAPPEAQAAMWEKVIQSHPRMGTALQEYGIDPADVNAGTGFFISQARGLPKVGDTKFGTSPQYYRDPQTGEVKVGQLSSSGGFRPAEIPGEVLPGLQFQNLGTEVVGMDKRTGQPVTRQPIDVAGKAAQTEVGKAQGEAQARYSQLESQGSDMLKSIDDLLKDPYLPAMTGAVRGLLPNVSSDARRVEGRLNQLQSQVFLQGYERLKGGGVITDFEGGKAEKAIARIQDPRLEFSDYVEAVNELREVVENGIREARRKAGMGAAGAPTQGAPQQQSPFPEYPNAQRAPDGNWYVEQNGQFFRIDQ